MKKTYADECLERIKEYDNDSGYGNYAAHDLLLEMVPELTKRLKLASNYIRVSGKYYDLKFIRDELEASEKKG